MTDERLDQNCHGYCDMCHVACRAAEAAELEAEVKRLRESNARMWRDLYDSRVYVSNPFQTGNTTTRLDIRAAAEEREACARMVDGWNGDPEMEKCAAAIRARGGT